MFGVREEGARREGEGEIERQRESFLYDFALILIAFSFALLFSADSLLESPSLFLPLPLAALWIIRSLFVESFLL